MSTHAGKMELSQQVPDEFYFAVNEAIGLPFGVRWVGDHFDLEGTLPGTTLKPKPSPEDWQKFWVSMGKIGVWNWNPSYQNENAVILDGMEWELSLRYQGKAVRSRGVNAYPGAAVEDSEPSDTYIRFVKALRKLTGISRSLL